MKSTNCYNFFPLVRIGPKTIFSTILLGYQAKMVRIGIIVALSDTHFCILSRDCFNLSREYFSLWAIKTSLDRNTSALLDPEVIFTRRSFFFFFFFFNLSSLLETTGRYFSKICAVHRLSRLVLQAKAAANLHCQRILANAIFYCYKSIVCRLH